MHPYIQAQLVQSRVADLHREAERRRLAGAARQGSRRGIRGAGRVAVPVALVIAAARWLTGTAVRAAP
jgi:hypothetical protein